MKKLRSQVNALGIILPNAVIIIFVHMLEAPKKRRWTIMTAWQPYVRGAKRHGLTCGVKEQSQASGNCPSNPNTCDNKQIYNRATI